LKVRAGSSAVARWDFDFDMMMLMPRCIRSARWVLATSRVPRPTRRSRAMARIALGGAALLLAHSPRSAVSQVAARPLGPIEARSQTLFDVVAAVRPLPGGDLLILDTGARRVSMLDSSLRYRETIADTSTIARYQSEIG